MLYATDSGADIRKTLAAVFMGGLITSTLLTLIVLPTLYALFANRFDPVADGIVGSAGILPAGFGILPNPLSKRRGE